ncbi:hypothetical protein EG68_03387 [Paragonimus skrjabini miyazakii]|uniref:Death domain-containing protein n=1 Tax=Paragonimus skrjabini miyazakii TaxID=59628 RepID=A0A8S9YVU1_9TREM|nr:hypothetical protein EG68_03387 [Paragonimus skrjabini miyazakii]
MMSRNSIIFSCTRFCPKRMKCFIENESQCDVFLHTVRESQHALLRISIFSKEEQIDYRLTDETTNQWKASWMKIGEGRISQNPSIRSVLQVHLFSDEMQISTEMDESIARATMVCEGGFAMATFNCRLKNNVKGDLVELGYLGLTEVFPTESRAVAFIRLELKPKQNVSSCCDPGWTVNSLFNLTSLYGFTKSWLQYKQLAESLGFTREEIGRLEQSLRMTVLDNPASPITPRRAFCIVLNAHEQRGGTYAQFVRALRQTERISLRTSPFSMHACSKQYDQQQNNQPTDLQRGLLTTFSEFKDPDKVFMSALAAHEESVDSGVDARKPTLRRSHSAQNFGTTISSDLKVPDSKQTLSANRKVWFHQVRRRYNVDQSPSSVSSVRAMVDYARNSVDNEIPQFGTPIKRTGMDTDLDCLEFQPDVKTAKRHCTHLGVTKVPVRNAERVNENVRRSQKVRLVKRTLRKQLSQQVLLPSLWRPLQTDNSDKDATLLKTIQYKLEETKRQNLEFQQNMDSLMRQIRSKTATTSSPCSPTSSSKIPVEESTDQALSDLHLWRLASLFDHPQAPSWKDLSKVLNESYQDESRHSCPSELVNTVTRLDIPDKRLCAYLILLSWMEKMSNPSTTEKPSLENLFSQLKTHNYHAFATVCLRRFVCAR